MNRAHNELEHHFNRYHRNGEITVANRGTVWHTDGGCYHLHNSFVRELWPCQACAQDVMTPHIRNENGVTLHNAMTGWLVSAQFFDTSNADYPMFPVVPGAAPTSGSADASTAAGWSGPEQAVLSPVQASRWRWWPKRLCFPFVSPIHPRVKCTPCTRGFTGVSLHLAVTRNHLPSREGTICLMADGLAAL